MIYTARYYLQFKQYLILTFPQSILYTVKTSKLTMTGNKARKLQRKTKFNRSDIIKSKLLLIIQILIVCYILFYLYIPIDNLFYNFHKYEEPAKGPKTFICVRIQ